MTTNQTDRNETVGERISRLNVEMNDWIEGRMSHVNLGPHAPYTPDVTAVMDAQEVVKRSAAIVALVAMSRGC